MNAVTANLVQALAAEESYVRLWLDDLVVACAAVHQRVALDMMMRCHSLLVLWSDGSGAKPHPDKSGVWANSRALARRAASLSGLPALEALKDLGIKITFLGRVDCTTHLNRARRDVQRLRRCAHLSFPAVVRSQIIRGHVSRFIFYRHPREIFNSTSWPCKVGLI